MRIKNKVFFAGYLNLEEVIFKMNQDGYKVIQVIPYEEVLRIIGEKTVRRPRIGI